MRYFLLTILVFAFSFSSRAIGPISGPTAVCTNVGTQFSNSTTGGTWTSSNLTIATINISTGVAYFLGVSTPTTVDIIYNTSSGSANLTVTINPNLMITGTAWLCAGGSSFLFNSVSGGVWSFMGSAATINAVTGELTGISPGSGTAIYTNPFGCVSSTSVSVLASPCSSISPISTILFTGCTSDTLYVPFYNCVVYQWQSSPDNVTWTNVGTAGPNSNSKVVTTTTTTYYRCAMTCSGTGGGLVYSVPAMVNLSPQLHASVAPTPDTSCTGLQVYLFKCSGTGAYNVTTYFGDGTSSNVMLSTSVPHAASITQHYAAAGMYTIKHVLYDGTTPIDSTTYAYDYKFCRSLPIRFYSDNNANCIKEPGELLNYNPILIEVDSNGIVIDTLSTTGGFNYSALGVAGTIYGFRLIPSPFTTACFPSGVVYDTILSFVNIYSAKYVGLTCSSAGFDLAANASIRFASNQARGTILVQNLLCTGTPGTLTMNFSPKYTFATANPAPTSTTATSITWDLSSISAMSPAHDFYFGLYPTAPLTMGDTVNTTITVTPTTGDANPSNNIIVRTDTITGPFDPNYIACDPGYLHAGAQMLYTIHFENTGTDTAHNIFVMDTLSDNLDINSMQIVTASAAMQVTKIFDGTHNIIKFDFPNIMLPDSSHHGLADGFVQYKIMQRPGLVDGDPINAIAGIFFDTNPVVLTEPITNTIAAINGPSSVCIGTPITLTDLVPGGSWTSSSANATVAGGVVTGVTTGTATISYTRTYLNGPITSTKLINIGAGGGSAGAILGPSGVCPGATIVLTNATAGGAWTTAFGNATISGPVVTGVTAGTDTVIYTVGSGVCLARATLLINVLPAPNAGILSGASALCEGSNTTLNTTVPGGAWSAFNANATVAGGVVTGVSPGVDAIYYSVSNSCGTAIARLLITVNPQPNPGTIAGPDAVCVGEIVPYTESVTGGVWAMYGTNATISGGMVTGNSPGIDSVYYIVNNSCGAKKATKAISVIVCPTSVNATAPANDMAIYPNPTTGMLTIADEQGVYTSYSITNAAGQIMSQENLDNKQTSIDITKYAPGIYYITLKGDHGSVVKKITKI